MMIEILDVNKNWIFLSIVGKDFKKELSTVKKMPVREYDSKKKIWHCSVFDISFLKKQCDKNNIKIKASKETVFKIKNRIKWRKNQLQLKYDNEIYYSSYDNLNLDMRKYQTVGAKFVYEAQSALILDQVGLGKTVQSLSVVQKRFDEGTVNFFIVICPNSLKRNWKEEIGKFTSFNVNTIDSGTNRKASYKSAYKFDGIIINYDLLIHDKEKINDFIFERGYEYILIIDEIQYIKSAQAQRSKITKQIADKAKYTIGLSATAIENSLLDIWSIFHSIDNSALGSTKSYKTFESRYLVTNFFGDVINDIQGEKLEQERLVEKWFSLYKRTRSFNHLQKCENAKKRLKNVEEKIHNIELMKKRISPFIIRRFKEDVLDELPDRIENNFWIKLSDKQRRIYNNILSNIADDIQDMERRKKIELAKILALINYLKQCVLSTELLDHEENVSTKLDEYLAFVKDADNMKIITFCSYTKMVDIIGRELNNLNIPNISIHGKNCKDSEMRLDMVNKFNTDKNIKVLVSSDILREGMNITSANCVINFDLLWNPAKMEQRIGRADRIGNVHKKINVINFITEDTVEEQIYQMQNYKKNMSSSILDDYKVEERMTFKNIKKLFDIK